MTKKQKEQAKQEAIAELRGYMTANTKVWILQRHRAASGMYHALDVYMFKVNGEDIIKWRITYKVAQACGFRYDTKHEAIGIGGCGFSAVQEIARNLSRVLFGDANSIRYEEI